MAALHQADLVAALREPGFQFLPAASVSSMLGGRSQLADWGAFAASWEHLELDPFMADEGRYRRRRHAVFAAQAGQIVRLAHRAHYQSLQYNPLNGGIERWYTPVDEAMTTGPTVSSILRWCQQTFDATRPGVAHWFIEMHQFRIEASHNERGQPTPEGMHRDGVDFVLVLLVARYNVASGTTIIGASDGVSHGSFTLTAPLDAMMLDDHRVYHGVTAIEPLDPLRPAKRDVLVVTFRALGEGRSGAHAGQIAA